MTAAMASAVMATANAAIADDVDVMNEVATRAGDDWASQVTEELNCDVLVVGGGFSGTCAAVQAAENGDKVLMCEGQSFMGGNGLGVERTNAYGLHPNSGASRWARWWRPKPRSRPTPPTRCSRAT